MTKFGVVLSLIGVTLLSGCASAHVVTVKRATADVPCLRPVPEQDLLVGIALSGGGSRAALFGLAGLEALAELRAADGASVLERSRTCRASPGAAWRPATTPSRSRVERSPSSSRMAPFPTRTEPSSPSTEPTWARISRRP